MPQYELRWDWPTLVNPVFLPLLTNEDRYLLLWGGRGSSKSDFVAKKLIFRCLSEPYFRFILIRQVYDKIKDSQYQTIKDIVYSLGLEHLFRFKESPLEISCINGNKFIARGCDNPQKLKSVANPTGAWYEEDIPDEDDFITITTTIRSSKAPYLQEIFTLNPEVEGNYEDNWFWQRFFAANHPDRTFRTTTDIKVGSETFNQAVTVHHSTYHDNLVLPLANKALLEGLLTQDPYYYQVYCLGQWGSKQVINRFYHRFDRNIHTGKATYDAALPLHLSFDFNTKPYNTLTIWQFPTDGHACQIDEICTPPPANSDEDQCKAFTARYRLHSAGVFVYGDPSGRAADTKVKAGENHYTLIMRLLAPFRPELRLLTVQPALEARRNWFNALFGHNEGGYSITVGETCTNTINDYLYCQAAAEGGKDKRKVKDNDGQSIEMYGHTSDANDYLLCWVWAKAFKAFSEMPIGGPRVAKHHHVNRVGY